MTLLISHPSRRIIVETVRTTFPSSSTIASRTPYTGRVSICVQCQSRAYYLRQTRTYRQPSRHNAFDLTENVRRRFSAARATLNDRDGRTSPEPSPGLNVQQNNGQQGTIDVRVAPQEDLPSHKEEQKWTLTKRFNTLMDHTWERLALVGHEINKYTGTDYSGVEALRREIKEQEELVKRRREKVRRAKAAFDEAQTLQMASQKEVVSLLERKNSWSSADLERYMTLIRSEHDNEQGVTATREQLQDIERLLEESRTRLERRERAQYHEEQIWSDSIRRNSTWVTFGLMGFNVVLLLANIGVVEPWRRQRMVREIKSAMDEKNVATSSKSSMGGLSAIEEAIEENVLPATTLEQAEAVQKADVLSVATAADDFVGGSVAVPVLQERLDENLRDMSNTIADGGPKGASLAVRGLLDRVRLYLFDLFSARLVAVRRIDMTALALESVLVGAAGSAILFFLRAR